MAAATGGKATLDTDLSGVIFNGVSITVSGADENINIDRAIRSISGVISVLLEEPLAPPELNVTTTVDYDIKKNDKARLASQYTNDKVMMQIDQLQAAGYTGKGVKVAVVDNAIDKRHPAITVDYVFDYRHPDDVDDPNPTCMSHATACGGLIKSKPGPLGYETGSAPGAQLGNYILGGCKHGGHAGLVLQALEQAVKDGTNILSISLGYGNNWKFLQESDIYRRVTEAGVLLVIAAGNAGNDGLFRGSEPCNAPGVLCVGMLTNTVVNSWEWRNPLYIDGKENSTGLSMLQSKIDGGWSSDTLPVWANLADNASGHYNYYGDGCVDLPKNVPDLSKYVVLIRRNLCNEDDMIDRVAAAGAKYILISEIHETFNNVFVPDLRRDHPGVTALGTVSGTQGVEMLKGLKAGKKITVNLKDPKLILNQRPREEGGKPVGEKMDAGSQWGPSFDVGSTTDVSAPGTDIPILAPVGSEGGLYGTASGTSLATPIVAGAAALLMEALGTKDPKTIANALINTAKPLKRHPNVGDGLASVAHQGGGLARLYDASRIGAFIDQDVLEFNDTLNRVERSFTITNRGRSSVTYSLTNVVADSVYAFANNGVAYPVGGNDVIQNDLYVNGAGASLSFSSTRVTVPGNGKATVKVTAKDPSSLDKKRLPVFSGFVKLAGSDGKDLTVPYFGVAGDADRVVKVTEALVQQSGVTVPSQSIVVETHVGMGTKYIEYYLLNADTGALIDSKPFFSVGHAAEKIFLFNWNGEVNGVKVPGGEYKIRVRSLRAFGSVGSTDSKDYITLDTPKFSFKRSN